MWQKKIKKTLFTLNIDRYCPEITAITYPLLKKYAQKIGADFYVIDKRKFKDWPVTYEKLQIYELAQKMDNDWNIYIDSDAMVHPDTPDFTQLLNKDTVMHVGCDFAPIRWKYDSFFKRDGRNFGSCNWFTIASDLCVDLWKPLDDLTKNEAIKNIYPTNDELHAGINPEHLIDDYVLSRNIARFGLKAVCYKDLREKFGIPGDYFYHEYLKSIPEKIEILKNTNHFWTLSEKERNQKIELDKANG